MTCRKRPEIKMKKFILPVILAFLAGCEYEVPLSQTPSAPANPALAGTWITTGTAGKNSIVMTVKTSATDYGVTYIQNNQTNCFSGFEVRVDDLNLLQLKLLTIDEKQPQKLYVFAKYERTADSLAVYLINPDVVSSKCQTTEELRKDFALHRNNPFLFNEPLKFSKSAPQ